ncbi:MAG: hypothetical protein AAFU78_06095, partial [Cyanobacteria bacterium J06633_2]
PGINLEDLSGSDSNEVPREESNPDPDINGRRGRRRISGSPGNPITTGSQDTNLLDLQIGETSLLPNVGQGSGDSSVVNDIGDIIDSGKSDDEGDDEGIDIDGRRRRHRRRRRRRHSGNPGGDDDDLPNPFNPVEGDDDDNHLIGTDAADYIIGYDGDDILAGGKGLDWLEGGAGADQFVLDASRGTDIILDFTVSEGDVIKVSAAAFGISTSDYHRLELRQTSQDLDGIYVSLALGSLSIASLSLESDFAGNLPAIETVVEIY